MSGYRVNPVRCLLSNGVNRLSFKLSISAILLVGLCLLALPIENCLAQEKAVRAKELIEDSSQYDGKMIVYRGEAIGDIMKRRNYFWVNVLDVSQAIGVWAPLRLKPHIRFVGSYVQQGDYLEIRGTFNARCRLHGGDLDIHAQDIKVINRGKFLLKRIEPERKAIALYMSLGVLCLMMLAIYKGRH